MWAHGIEELGHSPAHAGKGPFKNTLLLREVRIVELRNFRLPEQEKSERPPLTGVERHQFARRVQHEHLAFRIAAAGQWNGRGIKPCVAHEFGICSKREATNDRMQSVRTDDQVEATPARTLEDDVHARFILGQGLDGVSENVIHAIAARLVKDSREIPPSQLHIFGDDG